jgi:hypothetical protein
MRTGKASLGAGVFAVTGKVDRTMAARDKANIERCILVILFIFVFSFQSESSHEIVRAIIAPRPVKIG